mgnify:CR=1 FL=1|tara:strand:- start:3193 stop:3522 length:330 start_codon:yes stop_codon:yes gene_type:complete
MSLLNNYNNEIPNKNTIVNLLNNQFGDDKKDNNINNKIVDKRFNYNKPQIKSGLESLFEGNIKMPFGEDILFLQSEAIKAGPDEYNKFLKRHLNRTVKKEWIHKTIEFT